MMLSYDVIALYEDHSTGGDCSRYCPAHTVKLRMKEACEEVADLVKDGELFTEDEYENYIMDFKKRPTVVKGFVPAHCP